MERVGRGQITGAKYNPRKISPVAKAKLKKLLAKWGLIEALTLNKRTGNLVGGHQRLACLDALEGNDKYTMDICVVDIPPEDEPAANIMLNNPEIQGEWDLPLLASVIPEIKIADAGFEATSIDVIFDGTDFAPLFSLEAQAPAAQQSLGELAAMSSLKDEEPSQDTPASEQEVQRKASAEAVAEMRKSSKGMLVHEDTERYAIVIFDDRKQRDAWIESLGLEKGTRYVLGNQIVAHRRET